MIEDPISTIKVEDNISHLLDITEAPYHLDEISRVEDIVRYLGFVSSMFYSYERLYENQQRILQEPVMEHDQREWVRIFDQIGTLLLMLGVYFVGIGIVELLALLFGSNYSAKKDYIIGFVLMLILAYSLMNQKWKSNIEKQYKYKHLLEGMNDVFASKMFIDLYCSTASFLGEKFRNSDATIFFEYVLHAEKCSSIKEAQEMYKKELATKLIEQKAENVERIIKSMEALIVLAQSHSKN